MCAVKDPGSSWDETEKPKWGIYFDRVWSFRALRNVRNGYE